MSRSKRKTPVVGNTCSESEKREKRAARRRLRRKVRQATSTASSELIDGAPLPLLREMSDRWWFSKDGKQRIDVRDFAGRWGCEVLRKTLAK